MELVVYYRPQNRHNSASSQKSPFVTLWCYLQTRDQPCSTAVEIYRRAGWATPHNVKPNGQFTPTMWRNLTQLSWPCATMKWRH